MTRARAIELRPAVLAALVAALGATAYEHVFIFLGADYWPAAAGFEPVLPADAVAHVAAGTPGRRLAQLHDWLHVRPPEPRGVRPGKVARRLPVVRGVAVALDREAALAVAVRALSEDGRGSDRYQAWYVSIEGQRVAPKWLVSRLTGLPTGAFTTDDARRALAQLGIDVVPA